MVWILRQCLCRPFLFNKQTKKWKRLTNPAFCLVGNEHVQNYPSLHFWKLQYHSIPLLAFILSPQALFCNKFFLSPPPPPLFKWYYKLSIIFFKISPYSFFLSPFSYKNLLNTYLLLFVRTNNRYFINAAIRYEIRKLYSYTFFQDFLVWILSFNRAFEALFPSIFISF